MSRSFRYFKYSSKPNGSHCVEELSGRLSTSWTPPAAEDTRDARHQIPVFDSLSK